ncbi:ATP-binding protein [Sporomusa sp. GT1]|uniref:ATP-binding protein n=1 Tax=Sporomusa sp. GT1 TaxID=1534747 RepID=UPI00166BF0F3|nr:ATP-binding protein [Sporomusa sp. GT1]
MRKPSIKGLFMFGVFLACTIPFILGCLYVQMMVADETRQDFEKTAFDAMERVAASVNNQLQPANHLISSFAKDERTVQLFGAIGRRIIADSSQLAPEEYQHIMVADQVYRESLHIALVTNTDGYIRYPDFLAKPEFDPRKRDWYRQAVMNRGRPYITEPHLQPDGEYAVSVVHTVEQDNEIAGVVEFSWSLRTLQQEIEKIDIGENGYIVVLSQQGKIIACPKHPEWLLQTSYELNVPELMYLDRQGNFAGREAETGNGELLYVDVLPNTGWKVVAVFDKFALSKRVGDRLYPILYIYCAVMLCVLLFIYLLAQKKVIEPIRYLINGAQAITDGSSYVPISIRANDEFSVLANTFNKMIHVLKKNTDKVVEQNLEIKKREREFKTLVENAQDIIFRLSKNSNVVYANPVLGNYTGMPSRWLIGRHIQDCGFSSLFASTVRNIVDGKAKDGSLEIELLNKNGETEYFYAHIIPEYNDSQTVETVLCVLRNVTHKRLMEKEMLRLDRLNIIGEIAAAIAHEVRNPMTTVRGFLQLLRKKERDGERQSFYDLMIEELDRANEIITEFLSLARNKTIKLNTMNLNGIIDAITPLIRADALMTNRRLRLELGEIPDLELDAKEIRQLILNLARNGLEAMTSGGTLTISTCEEQGSVILKVSDQGSGIDPKVLKNLGMPFITTKENGTGLGLAVCYSIVERHQARIQVESGSGGTTFCIRFSQVLA